MPTVPPIFRAFVSYLNGNRRTLPKGVHRDGRGEPICAVWYRPADQWSALRERDHVIATQMAGGNLDGIDTAVNCEGLRVALLSAPDGRPAVMIPVVCPGYASTAMLAAARARVGAVGRGRERRCLAFFFMRCVRCGRFFWCQSIKGAKHCSEKCRRSRNG